LLHRRILIKAKANRELVISPVGFADVALDGRRQNRIFATAVTRRQGSKNRTPEQLADPVGLFGRSWTLFKFCLCVSGLSTEYFNPITLYPRTARLAKFFLLMRTSPVPFE